MTQDDVIRIAVKCQLLNTNNRDGVYAQALCEFAKLVAEHEREACAKIADEWAVGYPHPSTIIAEAIRARKKQANVVTNDTSQERVDETQEQRHEPVAWLCMQEHGDYDVLSAKTCVDCFPVYTQPQEATPRKPLTDDELANLWFFHSLDWMEFAKEIEAAHGIGEKE